MTIGMVFILVILMSVAIVHTLSFYLLISRRISFRESFRTVCVAKALNKFLFSGTGYIASSFLSRDKEVPFTLAFSAFAVFEIVSVSLWLGAGLFFGAKLAFRVPVFLAMILLFFVLIAWVKRKKITSAFSSISGHFKNMAWQMPKVIILAVFAVTLEIAYYYLLFGLFGFDLELKTMIKIISVSFTLGYLSPAPTGLGFKEAGMVAFLTNEGFPLAEAATFAVIDRTVATLFWAGLGSLTGYSVIRQELIKRFKKPSSL